MSNIKKDDTIKNYVEKVILSIESDSELDLVEYDIINKSDMILDYINLSISNVIHSYNQEINLKVQIIENSISNLQTKNDLVSEYINESLAVICDLQFETISDFIVPVITMPTVIAPERSIDISVVKPVDKVVVEDNYFDCYDVQLKSKKSIRNSINGKLVKKLTAVITIIIIMATLVMNNRLDMIASKEINEDIQLLIETNSIFQTHIKWQDNGSDYYNVIRTNKDTNISTVIATVDSSLTLSIFDTKVEDDGTYSYTVEGINKDFNKERITSSAQSNDIDVKFIDGFVNEDGYLYYYEHSKQLNNITIGQFAFGEDGRYSCGDKEMDAYIANVINSITTPEMTQVQNLEAIYDYVLRAFYYLPIRNPEKGLSGWELIYAKPFTEIGYGNCFSFAGITTLLVRGIGVEARGVSGTCYTPIGYTTHGWCEIMYEDEIYVLDTQMENEYARYYHFDWDLFLLKYGQGPLKYEIDEDIKAFEHHTSIPTILPEEKDSITEEQLMKIEEVQIYVGKDVSTIKALLGEPLLATYQASCEINGAENGFLDYDGFTVVTLKNQGREIIERIDAF